MHSYQPEWPNKFYLHDFHKPAPPPLNQPQNIICISLSLSGFKFWREKNEYTGTQVTSASYFSLPVYFLAESEI